MSEWTEPARRALNEYCDRCRQALAGTGADADEVIEDLRRHIEEDIRAARLAVVTEGTIYPLLSRLRVAGLISSRLEESSSGPARKYYSLTRDGRKVMETMNNYLVELNRSVTRLRKKGA